MTAAPTESENRMRRRLDLLSQVVLEMDGTGSLVFLNHAWTRSLGHAAADGLGQLLGKFVVAEDQRFYLRITLGEVPGTAGHAPIRILRSDGSSVWMEISIAPLVEGGMAGSLRDMSSRKLADEELARCSLAASEAKTGLLANISREMRTPLNIILGSTALAQDPGIEPLAFRILIAEDSDPNYAVAEIFLRLAGYTVTRAINGRLAVAAAVDLILMDVGMPEMDGLAATRRIREAERLASRRAVPILALSGHGGAVFRQSCLAAGCNGFLAKPVRHELMCIAVKEALQKQPGVGKSHE